AARPARRGADRRLGRMALVAGTRRRAAGAAVRARPGHRAPHRPRARPLRDLVVAGKVPVAFLAGFISVLTPCVLPLLPGYLSAVSAVEAGRLRGRGTGRGGAPSGRALTTRVPAPLPVLPPR